MRSISRSSASVVFVFGDCCLTRSSNRSASALRSPSAVIAEIASSSLAVWRALPLCWPTVAPTWAVANFCTLPASSAMISSAVRLPMPFSATSDRLSLDSIACAISPTGADKARRAVLGPIPLTVVKRLKNALSAGRRKPISFGSRLPPPAVPSR
jgi:hypothetical protein